MIQSGEQGELTNTPFYRVYSVVLLFLLKEKGPYHDGLSLDCVILFRLFVAVVSVECVFVCVFSVLYPPECCNELYLLFLGCIVVFVCSFSLFLLSCFFLCCLFFHSRSAVGFSPFCVCFFFFITKPKVNAFPSVRLTGLHQRTCFTASSFFAVSAHSAQIFCLPKKKTNFSRAQFACHFSFSVFGFQVRI